VYRHLTTVWPFQVRRQDLGGLLPRLDRVEREIKEAGLAGQQAQEAALKELGTSIGDLQWGKMSRKWRAIAWQRLCSTFVKRLEPLLAERARIARSEQLDAIREGTRAAGQSTISSRRAAGRWRNRISRKVRKIDFPRPRRVRVAPGLRIRRTTVETQAPCTSVYPTAAERRLLHIRSQQRRSKRRAWLHGIRMEWARRREEKSAASNYLWQFSHEDDRLRRPDRDLFAWPRLARKEREQLAREVDGFARISR